MILRSQLKSGATWKPGGRVGAIASWKDLIHGPSTGQTFLSKCLWSGYWLIMKQTLHPLKHCNFRPSPLVDNWLVKSLLGGDSIWTWTYDHGHGPWSLMAEWYPRAVLDVVQVFRECREQDSFASQKKGDNPHKFHAICEEKINIKSQVKSCYAACDFNMGRSVSSRCKTWQSVPWCNHWVRLAATIVSRGAAAFYGAQGSTCRAMAFSIHVLAEKCKLSWGTHRFLEYKEPQSKPCFSDKSLKEVLRHHWLTRLLASDAQGMTLPTREFISFKFCEFIKIVKEIQIVGSLNISCDS